MTFFFFFAFTGRICPKRQVYSDCVSSCPPSCASPQPPGPTVAQRQCREECVGGCECPPGLYLYQGNCLKRDDCPCFYRRHTYQSGDRIQQRCNTWYDWRSYGLLSVVFPLVLIHFTLFLFSHVSVCAVLVSGSVLKRNVQSSVVWWAHYRWPPLIKRATRYKEETVISLLWRWEQVCLPVWVCLCSASFVLTFPVFRTLLTGNYWWLCAVESLREQEDKWVILRRFRWQHFTPQLPLLILVSFSQKRPLEKLLKCIDYLTLLT